MDESQKRKEPKKIKMSPLVDRSRDYDTMEYDYDYPPANEQDENTKQNNSQSISKLESL